MKFNLSKYETEINYSYDKLKTERIVPRIWEHDHTVWKPEPTEITNRLGWLHSPGMMLKNIAEIESFVNEVRSEGFTHALLLGMGGSSLAPEVFRRVFEVNAGYLDLAVLDSTMPGAVVSFAKKLEPEKTLYITSTKSGGTVETLSLMKYFYNQTLKKIGKEKIGSHFIAITDPGSGLESLAKELNFRKIFLNDHDIGGRFSALSFFGLVPAGLIGIDLRLLLNRAQPLISTCKGDNDSIGKADDCAYLGTILGELARHGRDKVTFIISPAIEPLGVWIEQLIAESTGKAGAGILPVVGEAILKPGDYAEDRLFVYLKIDNDNTFDKQIKALSDFGHPVVQLHLNDKYDLGSEFFRWEMATAIAGYFLKINPFDQPNVEAAKVLARKLVAVYQEKGKFPESEPSLKTASVMVFTDEPVKNLPDAFTKFLAKADPGQNGKGRSYVTIQAFIQATSETDLVLQELRTRIQQKYKLATTVGYGPRFLHSTGQLHKGDGGAGLFIQITADHPEDTAIPDKAGEETSSITFGVLALAQALGDRQALLDTNRKMIRFHFSQETVNGIKRLVAAI